METHDVWYRSSGGDAGDVYEIRCPECGDIVTWAEYMWWKPLCSCGKWWNVEIKAISYNYREEN